MEKVNIPQTMNDIDEYWSQRIICTTNGQLFKLAKGIGSTRWHKHDDHDELFIFYKGNMTIQLRDKDMELDMDETFIVPRGVEHCPKSHEEVQLLIVGLNIKSNAAGGKPNLRAPFIILLPGKGIPILPLMLKRSWIQIDRKWIVAGPTSIPIA